MRKATKGRWEGFHPATNALWMHYLADNLLNLKAFPLEPSQKKRLRDFRQGFACFHARLHSCGTNSRVSVTEMQLL